ncbi:MarR family winged helix-turn-helix transcriptional regulator [Leucobacter chromiireducens]|uniref:MarR family transcriptional regulator n=1 Tax=Leucobacter chromiireducens subsp. solipictus TaxID=398235 RepID=A0ABS1SI26_9MICO|nr:MarR family winged helix-turn-helix transcriptional regulator [Leucobacter chromiireducens]MBL3679987.1 MarR family transcriptional regulator [Leucobacter chromiireducens subsp. solipictus]
MKHEDEVDRIIADWSAARPDLDLTPLAIFSRLWRITKHLDRARAHAFDRSGLASWEFDVLAVLRRGGEPFRQSPKVLVQQTMVSSGTMTNRIDRMVDRGLVQRLTDPNDGRGVLVEMTPLGLTLVDAAMTRLSDSEERLLGGIPRSERERLSVLLRRLALSVDRFEPETVPVDDD